jgi:hypothetical protein
MCDFVEQKYRKKGKKEQAVIQRTIEFFVLCEQQIFVCSRRNEYQSDHCQMSLSKMMSPQSMNFIQSLSFDLCLYRIKKNIMFFFFQRKKLKRFIFQY